VNGAPPPADLTGGEAKERFDLAKVTYDQVLDATKHQDDKVGRFLTAIAFLTAAAIAFGTRGDVLGVRYDVDGSVPLPGMLFAGFITFVVVAVVFLLMALGQGLHPPRSRPGQQAPSRLFFLQISQVSEEVWTAAWGPTVTAAEIRRQVTDNLVDESYNIALRADGKYRRTGEAQALFTMALLCFGLAVALAINVLADPGATPAAWDLRARLIATIILSSFGFSLGYGWIRSERATGWSKQTLYGLCVAGGLIPAAMLVVPTGGAAVVGAMLLFGEAWCWSRREKLGDRLRWLMAALAGALGIGAFSAVLAGSDRWRLAVTVTSVALFELPRLLSTAFRPAPGAAAP
jgi:hypothetical protein